MSKPHCITVEFVNDGHAEAYVTSQPKSIRIMGIPPSIDPELWLLSIILRGLQGRSPTINPAVKRSWRSNGAARPAYADGHAVERIRHNKKAMKGDL